MIEYDQYLKNLKSDPSLQVGVLELLENMKKKNQPLSRDVLRQQSQTFYDDPKNKNIVASFQKLHYQKLSNAETDLNKHSRKGTLTGLEASLGAIGIGLVSGTLLSLNLELLNDTTLLSQGLEYGRNYLIPLGMLSLSLVKTYEHFKNR